MKRAVGKGRVWLVRDEGTGAPFWAVRAPPHIVIRLKRVFGQLRTTHADVLVFSDTLESSRDLEWFLERHPMPIKEIDRDHLRERATEHRQKEEGLKRILSGRHRPKAFRLALPPRDYQRAAAELALERGGLLVADDLGLGKTVTALCVLSEKRTRPAVVVCHAHLCRQWKEQIERFLPHAKPHILRAMTPYEPPGSPDILIASYRKVTGWSETLAGFARTVIYDEVQELRRGTESQKGRAAKLLSSHARYRVGLSATPIYNFGGEIWNVMEALVPGALGTWTEFTTEWCDGYHDERKAPALADPVAFGDWLRSSGMMIRRTRADVNRELPGLTRVPQTVDCNRKALEDVSGSAGELARIILADAGAVGQIERFQAGGQLDAILRQATGIAKAPFVADFVRLLLDSEEKLVLFGWHRAVYDIWRERLADFHPLFFTGEETPAQKHKARQEFVEGKARLLVMSLRAGAGIDGLQAVCRTAVHGELDWSPMVHEQCDGRLFRDGQSDPVFSYVLVAPDGADPVIADVLGIKRGQIEGVRNLGMPDLKQRTDASGDHIKKLARKYAERVA